MEEVRINFETAKLAHEKGLPILQSMGFVTRFYHPRTQSIFYLGRLGKMNMNDLYYIPTQSLLQKWLREIHNIDIESKGFRNAGDIKALYYQPLINGAIINLNRFKTYEESLEKGLQEALSMI